jgi:uncharacterized protein with ParB-like and HNH nuclease domain
MQARETTLQPIIEGTKQYVVPLFQRSYSWDKRDWEILWNDLIELAEDGRRRTHFIGSVVTIPAESVPQGVAKYSLIDGQQRMTTIFIMLALLRDKARQDGDEGLADEINNTLLINPYKKDLDFYKLQPTQVDRETFQQIIVAEEATGQNQIISAYQFFERKYRQSGLAPEVIKDVITNNLTMVSIVLDAADNPHLVFESLNAKGRPLTQSDLIRNYFFMRVHVNQQDEIYSKYWRPMQEALGDSLTEYIRHYLMKGGTTVRQSDVYFSLKDIVNRADAVESLKEMAKFAAYYEKLLFPNKEPNERLRGALTRLNRLEVTTAYPFLLNCYHDYSEGRLSADELFGVLKVVENFILRRFVCSIPTNQLNKIFAPLYSQAVGKTTEGLLGGLKNVLQTKGYPKDAEFAARLKDSKLYGGGDRLSKTKLILESLEESFGHREQVPFGNLTIEHVMPQTLTEWWQGHLGDEWELTHELLLHTLGNLTLTAYNSVLSNDNFDVKSVKLRDSHLELNKYFAEVDTWKRENIEARSSYLAELALTIWPYFGDEAAEHDGRQDATGITPKKLLILGQEIEVGSWRDVLEQTMNTIAELEPDKFEQLIGQYPRLVNRDRRRFRAVRELKNGAFIEVNLSASAINSFCIVALESIDLTAEDWKVEGDAQPQDDDAENEESFMAMLQQHGGVELMNVAKKILDWVRMKNIEVGWGLRACSFIPTIYQGQAHHLFALRCEGKIETYFYWHSRKPPFTDEGLRLELMERLNRIEGVAIRREDITNKRPVFSLKLLATDAALNQFKDTYEWMIETIKNSPEAV